MIIYIYISGWSGCWFRFRFRLRDAWNHIGNLTILKWQTMNDRAYPTVNNCLGVFQVIWPIFPKEHLPLGEPIGTVSSFVFGAPLYEILNRGRSTTRWTSSQGFQIHDVSVCGSCHWQNASYSLELFDPFRYVAVCWMLDLFFCFDTWEEMCQCFVQWDGGGESACPLGFPILTYIHRIT